jgi:hypothetical protein
MPLAYWNTAKALFWIIIRRLPVDPLLDKDNELALAAVLLSCNQFLVRTNVVELTQGPLNFDLVRMPSAQAIDAARDELSAALQATHIFCHTTGKVTAVGSSLEGFYIEGDIGRKFHASFPRGMVQRQWPASRHGGEERRKRRTGYDADVFFAEAVSLLKRKKGLRPGFSRASFNAAMLDWTVDQWGLEPSSDWVRKHLALAQEAYEKISEFAPYGSRAYLRSRRQRVQ